MPTPKHVTSDEYRRLKDRLGTDHPLTQVAFDARLATVLAEERDREPLPEGWLWWLSFVDPTRSAPPAQQQPGGPGFLGVAIIDAAGPIHAARKAAEQGINPGGEMQAFPVPADDIPDRYRNRLLSRTEIGELEALNAE